MDFAWLLLGWAVIVIITMAVVVYLAHRWGREPFGWALLTAGMGPIALIALIGTRQSDLERRTEYQARPRRHETRRIVIACDGSGATERVARHMAEEYRDTGADMTLLAVLPHEAQRPGDDPERDERVERMVAPAKRVLDGAGVDVQVVAGYGKPGEEIIRCAADQDADVIAIGRRGAGLSKAMLGSVSDYVTKNAGRTVVVVD